MGNSDFILAYFDASALDLIRSRHRSVRQMQEDLNFACRQALRETSRTIQKYINTEFIRISHLKLAKVRNRVRLKFQVTGKGRAGAYASIWLGLNPVSIEDMNPKRVEGGGTSAAGKYFPMAFMPGGKYESIAFQRKGEARLPVEKVTIDINDDVVHVLRTKIEPLVEQIFSAKLNEAVQKMYRFLDMNKVLGKKK